MYIYTIYVTKKVYHTVDGFVGSGSRRSEKAKVWVHAESGKKENQSKATKNWSKLRC